MFKTTKEILPLLNEGQRELFLDKYDLLPNYLSPSQWKSEVNALLSSVLGIELNLSANVLNSIVNKVKYE